MNGDVSHSEAEPPSLPRKIHLVRGSEGYGFNLHGEKGIHGQFISAIDKGSPAFLHDVRVGDRVIAVNEEDMEDLPHSEVVDRIRAGGNEVTLLVVDELCDQFYKELGVKIPQDKFEIVSPKQEVAEVHEQEQPATEQEAVVENGAEEVKAEEPEINTQEIEPQQVEPQQVEEQQVEQVESTPPEETPQESDEQDDINDGYEEVVPLSRNQETPKAEEKPIESQPPVVTTTTTKEVEEKPPTTTTTTKVEPPSLNFDMSAARPKPRRNEVKKTKDWKQKYEEFNKL